MYFAMKSAPPAEIMGPIPRIGKIFTAYYAENLTSRFRTRCAASRRPRPTALAPIESNVSPCKRLMFPRMSLIIPKLGTILPNMGTMPQAISLSDALFSKVQQRVLALIFGHPERSFYTSEIVRGVRSGVGAVERELSRLQRSGLVTVERIGNQKHYRANREAPIFEELRGLVVKT